MNKFNDWKQEVGNYEEFLLSDKGSTKRMAEILKNAEGATTMSKSSMSKSSPEYQAKVATLLRRISKNAEAMKHTIRELNTLAEPNTVSPDDWSVVIIRGVPGPKEFAELAEDIGIRPDSITELESFLRSLRERGFQDRINTIKEFTCTSCGKTLPKDKLESWYLPTRNESAKGEKPEFHCQECVDSESFDSDYMWEDMNGVLRFMDGRSITDDNDILDINTPGAIRRDAD